MIAVIIMMHVHDDDVDDPGDVDGFHPDNIDVHDGDDVGGHHGDDDDDDHHGDDEGDVDSGHDDGDDDDDDDDDDHTMIRMNACHPVRRIPCTGESGHPVHQRAKIPCTGEGVTQHT